MVSGFSSMISISFFLNDIHPSIHPHESSRVSEIYAHDSALVNLNSVF